MLDSKTPQSSVTIWAILALGIMAIVPKLKQYLSTDDVQSLGIAIGGIVAVASGIWGRWRASKPLALIPVALTIPPTTPLILALLSLVMLAGCATDTPRTIERKGLAIADTANQSALLAITLAPAAGVSRAEVLAIEAKVIQPALTAERAIVASLIADRKVYDAAVLAKDQAAIDAAGSRSKLALDSLNAVALQLSGILLQYQQQTATMATTQPAR